MNTIAKILLYLAKALNYWFIVIPINLNLIAILAYVGILYISFGTVDMGEIRSVVGDGSFMHIFLGIFICIPTLVSFFSFLSPKNNISSGFNNSIDSAIAHRNMMMNHSSPVEAYEIMKKTGHLDVIKSGSDSVFREAKMGFDATVGNNGPASIYNDLMNK